MKAAAVFSRKVVDPVNSVAWFTMDGLWLAQLAWPAYVATGLTLLTGAVLVLFNRRRGQRLSEDLALNAWMWMNGLWVVSDLGDLPKLRTVALVVFGVGAVLLVNSVRPRNGVRGSLERFRKFRIFDE